MRGCIGFLALVLLSGPCLAQTNPLVNAGFEEGGSQGWYAWQTLKFSKVLEHPAGAHSGRYYLEMNLDPETDIGGYVQNAFGFLKWGDPFHAGAWIRTEQLRGQQAFLKIEFFDEDWVNYGVIESDHITGTRDWTYVSVTGAVPSRAEIQRLDKIQFVLCVSGTRTSGRAFFDDAWIGKGPALE